MKSTLNVSQTRWPGILVAFALLGSLIAWRIFYNPAAAAMPTLAIAQIVEHPSLDAVREGIILVLEENGYLPGKNIRLALENAQGSTQYAAEIAKKFAALRPDLAIAIGTPMAQSLKNALENQGIALLFSAVTDPVLAKLLKSKTHGDLWVAGVSDEQPITAQLDLIEKILPEAKNLGIVYHSGEINSSIMVKAIKADGRFTVIEKAVSKNSEITAAIAALVGKVDALYIPLDNLVVSSLTSYLSMSSEHKIPVFSADPDLVQRGVLASVGVSYLEIGRLTGEMALKILDKSATPQSLGIKKPQKTQLAINYEVAEALGIEVAGF